MGTNKDDIETISAPSKGEEKIEENEEVLEEKCKEEVEAKTDAALIQAEVKVVPEETDIQENKDDVATAIKDDILADLKEARESEIAKTESETEVQPEKPIASLSSSDDEQEKESSEIQDNDDEKKDTKDDTISKSASEDEADNKEELIPASADDVLEEVVEEE